MEKITVAPGEGFCLAIAIIVYVFTIIGFFTVWSALSLKIALVVFLIGLALGSQFIVYMIICKQLAKLTGTEK